MGRRGRKRQLEVESEYWHLLKTGVGTVAACRIVGITRKTGYRWWAENGGIPPVRLAETGRTSRYLSLLERQRIATLRGRGHGVREIARRLGRSPSTVSRELRRNLRPHDQHIYDGDLAHARARQRAPADPSCPAATQSGAPGGGAGQTLAGLEPAADRRASAGGLPGPAGLARVPRDHLPDALPRREGRAKPAAHPPAADGTAAAETTPAGRPAPHPVRGPSSAAGPSASHRGAARAGR